MEDFQPNCKYQIIRTIFKAENIFI